MKKISLGVAFMLLSVLTLSAEDSDGCFDAAIKSLERAEEKYGAMMSDEQATDYLNEAYADCVTWSKLD